MSDQPLTDADIDARTTDALAGALDTTEGVEKAFRERGYIPDRSLSTAVFLALRLGRPLLLEGEAGVGKTELAKVLAASLGARLIRLQCYEGLDVNTAVYEWNYPRQMLEIRLLEARGAAQSATAHDIFGPEFLIKRPLLQALESTDELDRPAQLLSQHRPVGLHIGAVGGIRAVRHHQGARLADLDRRDRRAKRLDRVVDMRGVEGGGDR